MAAVRSSASNWYVAILRSPVGTDFTDVLHRVIAASDALLVDFGRQWAADGPNAHGSGLFGDKPMLRHQDAVEARLQIGWERLQAYLGRL